MQVRPSEKPDIPQSKTILTPLTLPSVAPGNQARSSEAAAQTANAIRSG